MAAALAWLGPAEQGAVGLAVSGGGDSMAMLHLMARAAGCSLHAVTVDHRLRPEATAEAAFVAAACRGLGVPHSVLVWRHGDIGGNLMEAARAARYGLMAEWARGQGIGRIALAHTADDQAETVLIGLARAAGLDGLCGMRPAFTREDVVFERPFLGHGRAELRAFLRRHGLGWVEDPTNADERFTRTRARRALAALAPLGITPGRLASVARNLAAAQGVVRDAVARAGRDIVTEAAGSLRYDIGAMARCGAEIERRLLIAMVRWIGTPPHPPREARVHALVAALAAGRDATLGGVRFRQREGIVIVSREARALPGPVAAGELWDGRWRVTGADGEVRALGSGGLGQCPGWRATGLPRQVLEVTPAVWRGERLVAAPCAGFGPGRATCTPSFAAFLLSH